ncbi:hypothetical protein SDJN03_29801, partial [Cucurbita argyrosperma subsp. sororia]
MGSKAPSWADQWGSGDYGVEDDDNTAMTKKGSSNGNSSKKMADVKAAASAGFVKAKSAAAVGAQKVKSGTSVGIKWVKNQYQKKKSFAFEGITQRQLMGVRRIYKKKSKYDPFSFPFYVDLPSLVVFQHAPNVFSPL